MTPTPLHTPAQRLHALTPDVGAPEPSRVPPSPSEAAFAPRLPYPLDGDCFVGMDVPASDAWGPEDVAFWTGTERYQPWKDVAAFFRTPKPTSAPRLWRAGSGPWIEIVTPVPDGEAECAGCDPRDFDRFAAAASAAITAMRVPTEAMVEAGWPHTADPCWPENVKAAWQAMIDAILTGDRP